MCSPQEKKWCFRDFLREKKINVWFAAMSTSFVSSTPIASKMTRSKSGLADMPSANSPKSSFSMQPKHSKDSFYIAF